MGYLKLYIGPMFSSKTTRLLEDIDKYKTIYKEDEIMVINNILDQLRHEEQDSKIESHDRKTHEALMLKNLNELIINKKELYEKSKVIVIDEGQFFDDIYDFIYKELMIKENDKTYIIAGLQGGFKLNFVGEFYKLIPLADDIIHLSAYCIECKNKANFVYRKTCENGIFVGSKDMYEPVCRYHYLHKKML